MDLLTLVAEKVEPKYIDGHIDKEELRVAKKVKIFQQQVDKGIMEIQVWRYEYWYNNRLKIML